MKRFFHITGALFLLMIYSLNAQVKYSHEVVLGSLQLKDENNLGMVFGGAQLNYRFGTHWRINVQEVVYQPKIGFGLARKRGMIGGQIHIAPVNVTSFFCCRKNLKKMITFAK